MTSSTPQANRRAFEYVPLRLCEHHELPFDLAIYVFVDTRVEGNVVASYRAPVEFNVFIGQLSRTIPPPSNRRHSTVPRRPDDRTLSVLL